MFIFRKGHRLNDRVASCEIQSPHLGTTGTHQLTYVHLRNISQNRKSYQWIKSRWYASTEIKQVRTKKNYKAKVNISSYKGNRQEDLEIKAEVKYARRQKCFLKKKKSVVYVKGKNIIYKT